MMIAICVVLTLLSFVVFGLARNSCKCESNAHWFKSSTSQLRKDVAMLKEEVAILTNDKFKKAYPPVPGTVYAPRNAPYISEVTSEEIPPHIGFVKFRGGWQ